MEPNMYLRIAEAALDKPFRFVVKSETQEEDVRSFVVKPPTFRTLIATSGKLAKIGITDYEALFQDKNVFQFISEHGNTVLEVMCILIAGKEEYDAETYSFLQDNLTPWELYDILIGISLRIGIQDFQKATIGIIPMGLIQQAEIIAAATQYSTPTNLQAGL